MSAPTAGLATGTGRDVGGTSTAFLAALRRQPLVAVVRNDDPGAAAEIARGCIAGGLRLIEITLTTPGALELITDLVAEAPADVTIGAGTVLDTGQVHAAAAAGARFLVSPATDPQVMAAAHAAGVPFVPGAATPSEVACGARLGAPAVKVFPAGGLGLPFLKSVRAVMPHVLLLPSGGIGVTDAPAWLDAGAAAVAIARELDAAHAIGGQNAVAALARSAAATAARHAAPHNCTTSAATQDSRNR